MFWKFNVCTGSSIETLLENEDLTLRELLDEDDLLQECKSQNKKLLDFIVLPKNMIEMMNIITKEPPDEGDMKLRYRYAHKSCELLTLDVPQINEILSGDRHLLEELYNSVDIKEPLNPLMASFFGKTISHLFAKKTEVMLEFMRPTKFVELLLRHLDVSAISNVLVNLISIDDDKMRNEIVKWLAEEKLVEKLVERIDVTYGEEFISNAANVLIEIIQVGRDHNALLQEKAEPNPLLERIESAEVVRELLNSMFWDTSKDRVIICGVQVLITLIVFQKSPGNMMLNVTGCLQIDTGDSPPIDQPPPPKKHPPGIENALLEIATRLVDFQKLLINPPKKPALTLTTGVLDPPVGICRIEIAHLLNELVGTNSPAIKEKLAELETLIVLLELFFSYAWNNILHIQIMHTLEKVMVDAMAEVDDNNKSQPLLDQIFIKYRLTTKIVDCFEENSVKLPHGQHRKAYLGHLETIAQMIVVKVLFETSSDEPWLTQTLRQLPEDEQQKWENFIAGKLADINIRNKGITGISKKTIDMLQHSGIFEDFGSRINPDFEAELWPDSIKDDREPTFSIQNAALFDEICSSKDNDEFGEEAQEGFWCESTTPFGGFESSEIVMDSPRQTHEPMIDENSNSSSSDEEKEMKSADECKPDQSTSSKETPMDFDSQDAVFESPMEAAPSGSSDPWGQSAVSSSTSTNPFSDSNWADFSNFGTFNSDQSGNGDETVSSTTDSFDPFQPDFSPKGSEPKKDNA